MDSLVLFVVCPCGAVIVLAVGHENASGTQIAFANFATYISRTSATHIYESASSRDSKVTCSNTSARHLSSVLIELSRSHSGKRSG